MSETAWQSRGTRLLRPFGGFVFYQIWTSYIHVHTGLMGYMRSYIAKADKSIFLQNFGMTSYGAAYINFLTAYFPFLQKQTSPRLMRLVTRHVSGTCVHLQKREVRTCLLLNDGLGCFCNVAPHNIRCRVLTRNFEERWARPYQQSPWKSCGKS